MKFSSKFFLLAQSLCLYAWLFSCNPRPSLNDVPQTHANKTVIPGEIPDLLKAIQSTSLAPNEKVLSESAVIGNQPTNNTSANGMAYPIPVNTTQPIFKTAMITSYPYPIVSEVNPNIVTQPTELINEQHTPEIIINSGLSASNPASVRLSSGKNQLIEFFAYWDPISKSMAPVLNKLEALYKGRITFIFLDIDDPKNDLNKNELGYQYPPHIFLIDSQGKILKQWIGYVDEAELITAFSGSP